MNSNTPHNNLIYYLIQTRNSINQLLTTEYNYPHNFYYPTPHPYHYAYPYNNHYPRSQIPIPTPTYRNTRNQIDNLINRLNNLNTTNSPNSTQGRTYVNPVYNVPTSYPNNSTNNTETDNYHAETNESHETIESNETNETNDNTVTNNTSRNTRDTRDTRDELPDETIMNNISQNLRNRLRQVLPELVEITLYRETANGNTQTTTNTNPNQNINFEDVIVPTDLQSLRNNSTVDLYQNIETDFDKCCICRDTLMNTDIIRKINSCQHIFHMSCIDTWLESNTMCPICRCDLRSNTSENENENVDTSPY